MMITKMKMPKMTKMKITKKKNMLMVSVCFFISIIVYVYLM